MFSSRFKFFATSPASLIIPDIGPITAFKGSRKPSNYTILESWVFDNFVLADELFAKALQGLETYVSVDNNLRGKLVSSLELPITFDERFKVTSISFRIHDFNLLSCELNNLTFKALYWIILY